MYFKKSSVLLSGKYALFICFIPFALLIFLVFKLSIFWPTGDDLSVLQYFVLYDQSSFLEKIGLIFAQHNEHRIALTRVIGLLIYYITGDIHLRWWILIGNTSLLGLLFLFYKECKKINVWLIIPVSFILFSFIQYSNNLGAIMNCNIFFIVLSALLLYLIINNAKFFKIFIVSFLLMFSNGGGIISFFICLGIYLYRKEYKKLLRFTLISILLCGLYFYNFHSVTYHPDPVKSLLHHPLSVIEKFFEISGQIAINKNVLIPVGVIMFIFFIYLTFIKWYQRRLFLYSLLLLMFCLIITSSITRYGFGVSQQYSTFSMIILMIYLIAGYDILVVNKTTSLVMNATTYITIITLGALLLNVLIYAVHFKNIKNFMKANIEMSEKTYLRNESTDLIYLVEKGFLKIPSNYSFIHSRNYYDSIAKQDSLDSYSINYKLSVNTISVEKKSLNISGSIQPRGDILSTFLIFSPIKQNLKKTYYGNDLVFRVYLLDDTTTSNYFNCKIPKNFFKKNTDYLMNFKIKKRTLLSDTIFIQ